MARPPSQRSRLRDPADPHRGADRKPNIGIAPGFLFDRAADNPAGEQRGPAGRQAAGSLDRSAGTSRINHTAGIRQRLGPPRQSTCSSSLLPCGLNFKSNCRFPCAYYNSAPKPVTNNHQWRGYSGDASCSAGFITLLYSDGRKMGESRRVQVWLKRRHCAVRLLAVLAHRLH